jgi:hypothetical protein
MDRSVELVLSQSFDCLILVHPQISTLGEILNEFKSKGNLNLNISKDLSAALLPISAIDRSRFSQQWLKEKIANFQNSPIICSSPDLLFHPSLKIDLFEMIRQAARVRQVIFLWPGDYSTDTLSYAIPNHHHYRAWKLTKSLLIQPKILIHSIYTAQGV